MKKKRYNIEEQNDEKKKIKMEKIAKKKLPIFQYIKKASVNVRT